MIDTSDLISLTTIKEKVRLDRVWGAYPHVHTREEKEATHTGAHGHYPKPDCSCVILPKSRIRRKKSPLVNI